MLIVFSLSSSFVMFFPNIMKLLDEIGNTGLDPRKDDIEFGVPKIGDGFDVYIRIDEKSRSAKELKTLLSTIYMLLNDLFELAPNKKFQIKREGNNWVTLC